MDGTVSTTSPSDWTGSFLKKYAACRLFCFYIGLFLRPSHAPSRFWPLSFRQADFEILRLDSKGSNGIRRVGPKHFQRGNKKININECAGSSDAPTNYQKKHRRPAVGITRRKHGLHPPGVRADEHIGPARDSEWLHRHSMHHRSCLWHAEEYECPECGQGGPWHWPMRFFGLRLIRKVGGTDHQSYGLHSNVLLPRTNKGPVIGGASAQKIPAT